MTNNSETTKSSNRIGRLALPEERRDWLRVMLLSHYEAEGGFWREWVALYSRFERLLEALVQSSRHGNDLGYYKDEDVAWKALARVIGGWPSQVPRQRPDGSWVRLSSYPHLQEYRSELVEMAERVGLRSDWAPAWIHASFLEWMQLIAPREWLEAIKDRLPPGLQRVVADNLETSPTQRELRGRLKNMLRKGDWDGEGMPSLTRIAMPSALAEIGVETLLEQRWRRTSHRRLRNFNVSGTWTEPEGVIRIEARYEPWPRDDWHDVERAIVREARAQRDAIKETFRQAGFESWDGEPQMQEHIRWLFQRIWPRTDARYPTAWSAIARDAGVSVTGVTRSVTRLATAMAITLPAARRGRPQKFE